MVLTIRRSRPPTAAAELRALYALSMLPISIGNIGTFET